MNSKNSFLAQANWLAIGYSTPAAVGFKCALRDKSNELQGDKRVIVITGDGAFQETCQSVSSMINIRGQEQKHNTVIFVLNNGIYGIEQQGVNPNPFRKGSKINYKDNCEKYPKCDDEKYQQSILLDELYSYNQLNNWDYEKLTEVYKGGKGIIVETIEGLRNAIIQIKQEEKELFIVNIILSDCDSPTEQEALNNCGEDEILNLLYPPETFY